MPRRESCRQRMHGIQAAAVTPQFAVRPAHQRRRIGASARQFAQRHGKTRRRRRAQAARTDPPAQQVDLPLLRKALQAVDDEPPAFNDPGGIRTAFDSGDVDNTAECWR